MAFLDKLGQVANKVGEAASDAADLGKAKGKIVMEKGKVTDGYQALGQYVYEAYQAGNGFDDEALAKFVEEIKGHLHAIELLEADAEAAKSEFKNDIKSEDK